MTIDKTMITISSHIIIRDTATQRVLVNKNITKLKNTIDLEKVKDE